MEERLNSILSSFEGKPEDIIPMLQRVQEEFGYLSEHSMLEIARFTRSPQSRVYAIATFYAQFRFTPIGKKHVMVCRGTACYVKGATRIQEMVENHLGITEGETTPDMEFSLETVACIGACGLSPCIMINKKVEAKVTPERLTELLGKSEAGNL